MIKTINLCKYFGARKAVENLNLAVKAGEFYAFLGPNAAGKTTTIKLLSGLLRPTKGAVFIKDFDMQQQSLQAKRIIGYIPDAPFVYEKLTPREFIELVGALYGQDQKKLGESMEWYFEFLGLQEVRDVLIDSLSHGLRQRVVYIAALIHKPLVILIDEPLVGLDPYSIHLIKNLLKQKCRQGSTIFMSTHILSIAEELADTIGIIDKGELIVQGTFSDLCQAGGGSARLEDIFLKLTKGLHDEPESGDIKGEI